MGAILGDDQPGQVRRSCIANGERQWRARPDDNRAESLRSGIGDIRSDRLFHGNFRNGGDARRCPNNRHIGKIGTLISRIDRAGGGAFGPQQASRRHRPLATRILSILDPQTVGSIGNRSSGSILTIPCLSEWAVRNTVAGGRRTSESVRGRVEIRSAACQARSGIPRTAMLAPMAATGFVRLPPQSAHISTRRRVGHPHDGPVVGPAPGVAEGGRETDAASGLPL